MNSAPTPVLQMQHVRKTYRPGEVSVQALRDIDVDFYPAEFIVFFRISYGNRTEDEVVSGLAPGDTVVRHPINELSDGARVSRAPQAGAVAEPAGAAAAPAR